MARKKDYFEVKLMVSCNHQVNGICQVVGVDVGHDHDVDKTVALAAWMVAEHLPAVLAGNNMYMGSKGKPVQTKVSIQIERNEYSSYGK